MNFEWNQIPLFISDSTRTLYTQRRQRRAARSTTPSQSALQNAGTRTSAATIGADAALTARQSYDMRSRRDIGSAEHGLLASTATST